MHTCGCRWGDFDASNSGFCHNLHLEHDPLSLVNFLIVGGCASFMGDSHVWKWKSRSQPDSIERWRSGFGLLLMWDIFRVNIYLSFASYWKVLQGMKPPFSWQDISESPNFSLSCPYSQRSPRCSQATWKHQSRTEHIQQIILCYIRVVCSISFFPCCFTERHEPPAFFHLFPFVQVSMASLTNRIKCWKNAGTSNLALGCFWGHSPSREPALGGKPQWT